MELFSYNQWMILVFFIPVSLALIVRDLRERRLPNILILGIFLFGILWNIENFFVGRFPIFDHIVQIICVLGFGFYLYTQRKIGAGDIKLLMGLSLFFLIGNTGPFILIGNIAGITLAFLMITLCIKGCAYVYHYKTLQNFSLSSLFRKFTRENSISSLNQLLLWVWIIFLISILRFALTSLMYGGVAIFDIFVNGSGIIIIFYFLSRVLYRLFNGLHKATGYILSCIFIAYVFISAYYQNLIGILFDNLYSTFLFLTSVGIIFRCIQFSLGFLLKDDHKNKIPPHNNMNNTLPYSLFIFAGFFLSMFTDINIAHSFTQWLMGY